VALVVLSSRRSVMGEFTARKTTIAIAAVATLLIVILNIDLVKQALF
jgi:manganese transport protein